MTSLKQFSDHLLTVLFERIFKEHMSPEAAALLKGTSHVGVGGLIAAALSFVFYILGARLLGPENYGNFSLVVSIGAILGLSMSIGITPMLKYASESRDDAVRSEIISTAYIQIAFFTVASGAIFLLLSGPLSNLFGVSEAVFIFAIAYAIVATSLALTQYSLRIFFKLKAFALINASQSAFVLAIFIAFIAVNLRVWQSAAYATVLTNAALSLLLIVYLRKYITLHYARSWGAQILKYGAFSMPGAVALALMEADKILINVLKTTADVGIYQAYSLVSINIAAMLWNIVNAGFFPYASRSPHKLAIFLRISKAVPYLALFVPIVLIVEGITFIFFGHQYPFSVQLALLFSVAATVYFLYECYSWLIVSQGVDGVKVNTISSVIALVVLLSLDVLLIPLIGITGAALALIFAYLAPTIFIYSRRHVLDTSESL